MSDLTKALRQFPGECSCQLGGKAADEIERLTQVIDDAYTAATTGDMVSRWYDVQRIIEDFRSES